MASPRAYPLFLYMTTLLAACRGEARERTSAQSWPHLDEKFLEASAATQGFKLGRPQPLAVTEEGAVLFRRTQARDRRSDLYELDTKSGQVKVLATVDTLLGGGAEKLSDQEKARRERTRTATSGIVDIDVSDDGTRVLIPLGERVFVFERPSGHSRELEMGSGFPFDPHLSPDGQHVAFARDGDLWVIDVAGGVPRRLTEHSANIDFGTAEFVAQEEFGRTRGYWWSPDSSSLAFQRTDTTNVETLYVADSRHPERVPVPFKYPRAGRPNAVVDLGIVSTRGGAPRWVSWDRARFPYLTRVSWSKGSPLNFVVENRDQTELALLKVDPASGNASVLLSEKDDAWLNLAPGSPTWFEDGSGFLWVTEQENGYSLERYDATGQHVRSVTDPSFGLRRLVAIEPGGKSAVVQAATDAREEHVFRVPLDGTPPAALTSGGGVHRAFANHGVVVVTSSLRAGGASVAAFTPDGLRRELPSSAERPSLEPTTRLESVEVEGRTLYTAITRPRPFDEKRRYPVLVSIYAGPGIKFVLDARDNYVLDQWYADAGFVVVRADGRGTPHRGRTWERAISRDFMTVPLADQTGALKAMAARHPEMDASRTGVFGWSFGGYMSTLAVLLHPEVFKAAVAGAPAIDWQLYDTAYTERYLKTPAENPAGYERSSALTYAAKLERPLLIIHGITDDNVHFAHTLALIEALYLAGKRAEVVTLPTTHMVPDPKLSFAREKIQVDFFREHLGAP